VPVPPEPYRDRWITCTDTHVVVRGYYFPTGRSRRIPYREIASVTSVPLRTLRGRWRLWGTASPRYWAHLDPGRPRKTGALVLDLGRRIRPVLTPDDPDTVRDIIDARHRSG
jgi:hypothetical protein